MRGVLFLPNQRNQDSLRQQKKRLESKESTRGHDSSDSKGVLHLSLSSNSNFFKYLLIKCYRETREIRFIDLEESTKS